ncbi:MAG TPA: DNA-formamidopyrimidine glycosylase family protein [Terracidiphilus sp.]|nr:DNA-formamidopyrimidine glycosylase family protein [Terracidiphilus sp.]
MPEGDTIFRTARTLGRAFGDRPITAFRSTYPYLTRFNDDSPLAGQTVQSVESRGKWLFIHFSGGATLATHMLMSGSWHIYRHGQPWHLPRSYMRIVIENQDYIAVGFKVPVAEMHTSQSLARDRRFPSLNIDVLNPEFDTGEAALRIAAHRNEEIGDVLLHQEAIAGVGNVFKSEVCFVTETNPFARVAALSLSQIQSLIAASVRLVRANVLEDSGDTIVTYGGRHRRTTHSSNASESLWVYGRAGEPCRRCGELVRRRIQGPDARVTFWCPQCQPMPDGSDVDG